VSRSQARDLYRLHNHGFLSHASRPSVRQCVPFPGAGRPAASISASSMILILHDTFCSGSVPFRLSAPAYPVRDPWESRPFLNSHAHAHASQRGEACNPRSRHCEYPIRRGLTRRWQKLGQFLSRHRLASEGSACRSGTLVSLAPHRLSQAKVPLLQRPCSFPIALLR